MVEEASVGLDPTFPTPTTCCHHHCFMLYLPVLGALNAVGGITYSLSAVSMPNGTFVTPLASALAAALAKARV